MIIAHSSFKEVVFIAVGRYFLTVSFLLSLAGVNEMLFCPFSSTYSLYPWILRLRLLPPDEIDERLSFNFESYFISSSSYDN